MSIPSVSFKRKSTLGARGGIHSTLQRNKNTLPRQKINLEFSSSDSLIDDDDDEIPLLDTLPEKSCAPVLLSSESISSDYEYSRSESNEVNWAAMPKAHQEEPTRAGVPNTASQRSITKCQPSLAHRNIKPYFQSKQRPQFLPPKQQQQRQPQQQQQQQKKQALHSTLNATNRKQNDNTPLKIIIDDENEEEEEEEEINKGKREKSEKDEHSNILNNQNDIFEVSNNFNENRSNEIFQRQQEVPTVETVDEQAFHVSDEAVDDIRVFDIVKEKKTFSKLRKNVFMMSENNRLLYYAQESKDGRYKTFTITLQSQSNNNNKLNGNNFNNNNSNNNNFSNNRLSNNILNNNVGESNNIYSNSNNALNIMNNERPINSSITNSKEFDGFVRFNTNDVFTILTTEEKFNDDREGELCGIYLFNENNAKVKCQRMKIVFPINGKPHYPISKRKSLAKIVHEDEFKETKLFYLLSELPKVDAYGKVAICFGDVFVVPSNKNLIVKNDVGKIIFMIYKISQSSYKMHCSPPIAPMVAFGIGISILSSVK